MYRAKNSQIIPIQDEGGASMALNGRANSGRVRSSQAQTQANRPRTMITADHPLIELLAGIDMVWIEAEVGQVKGAQRRSRLHRRWSRSRGSVY